MISKEKFFCSEKEKTVEALVDKKASPDTPMTCTAMLTCEATTFCKFVNPLTTRNPLKKEDTEPAMA